MGIPEQGLYRITVAQHPLFGTRLLHLLRERRGRIVALPLRDDSAVAVTFTTESDFFRPCPWLSTAANASPSTSVKHRHMREQLLHVIGNLCFITAKLLSRIAIGR